MASGQWFTLPASISCCSCFVCVPWIEVALESDVVRFRVEVHDVIVDKRSRIPVNVRV
jgi:hypothetical protein